MIVYSFAQDYRRADAYLLTKKHKSKSSSKSAIKRLHSKINQINNKLKQIKPTQKVDFQKVGTSCKKCKQSEQECKMKETIINDIPSKKKYQCNYNRCLQEQNLKLRKQNQCLNEYYKIFTKKFQENQEQLKNLKEQNKVLSQQNKRKSSQENEFLYSPRKLISLDETDQTKLTQILQNHPLYIPTISKQLNNKQSYCR